MTKKLKPFAFLMAAQFPSPPSGTLASSEIEFSNTVRDLGVFLDSDLSMKQHVTKVCQLAYMELRRIAAIRPFLTENATKTLVSSYILSRLDYCNCVLLNCPANVIQPLQRVQNYSQACL